MDIILQGQHEGPEALESLERVLDLFKERYRIKGYREIHLTVTLLDEQGEEVELIDTNTHQPYRVFEVYRAGFEFSRRKGIPMLHLVVDNTK
jgi:hypothetical protein